MPERLYGGPPVDWCTSVQVDGFSHLLSAQDRRVKAFCTVQLKLGLKPVKESIHPRQPTGLEFRDNRSGLDRLTIFGQQVKDKISTSNLTRR